MRLIKKDIEKDGAGYLKVIPEHVEDFWHLYNIISENDGVRCSTVRKIEKSTGAGKTTEKRRFYLTIAVKNIDFDLDACSMRISGKNIAENDFVKIGQFHTMDIELNREISISKKYWDAIHIKRIEDATDISKSSDVVAIIMEEGLAYLCLISEHMTFTKQKIEVSVPKKRYTSTAHDKGVSKFFDTILNSIMKNVDFDVVKCIVIASPGFYNQQFLEYVYKTASQKDEYREILSHKSKFLLVHSNSGHREALTEVLSDPSIISKLENTKAFSEVKALEEFYNTMKISPEKAFYGYDHVNFANQQNAIQTLMITDELFRSSKIKERKKYVQLVESVQESGGQVLVFSSAHISGQQLKKLSGIAATLRFQVILEEEEDDTTSSDSSDDENEKIVFQKDNQEEEEEEEEIDYNFDEFN
eukprot:gene159-4405_t